MTATAQCLAQLDEILLGLPESHRLTVLADLIMRHRSRVAARIGPTWDAALSGQLDALVVAEEALRG